MLERLRHGLARWIAPPTSSSSAPAASAAGRIDFNRARHIAALESRMYASARRSRLNADWQAGTSSANNELHSSGTALRNFSRSLVRDNSYAKRARGIVIDNVIGCGIGLQAQVKTTRKELNTRVNDAIEEAFTQWSRPTRCHTGGILHFADIERLLKGEIFEAGEIILRKHYRAFGDSAVPFALEIIEPERLADEWTQPNQPLDNGATYRLGIEVDRFDRPLAYWIKERHPGDLRANPYATQRVERVPADQIMHLYLVERWPQARGVPWLNTVIQRLRDIDGYSEAEIVAARAAACYMGFIKSPEDPTGSTDPAVAPQMEFAAGMLDHLGPGEDITFNNPNRPNPAMEAFMRALLREIAAGVGTSYESLSRDYSQSNYSSSRLALLDDRALWRMLQGWFIRSFRAELHREWLQQAVLAGAIPGISVAEYMADPAKFQAARFKPRGWGWIDPTKEVEAYKEAVRCGFTTVADVIAATGDGRDLEDVLEGREHELAMMEAKDLVFDTHVSAAAPSAPPPVSSSAGAGPTEGDDDDDDEASTAPARGRLIPIAGSSAR